MSKSVKTNLKIDLKNYILEIANWPKPGINFKDITPLLQDKNAFRQAIDELVLPFANENIDVVVGIDARGFILAAAVAYKLRAGLALIRKKGKLPRKTVRRDYALEYGSNTIEMHDDAIKPGARVLIVDDVLATGGTISATCEIVEQIGGNIIGVVLLLSLNFLHGEKKINRYKVNILTKYDR